MTAITIDKDKAIELLEKQVEKKGEDYVYPFASCEYFAPDNTPLTDRNYIDKIEVTEGQPLCILGHVYADLGLSITDLVFEHDGNYEETDNGSLNSDGCIPNPDKVILTRDARIALGVAQDAQDAGLTWGTALVDAKEAVA